MEFSLIRQRRLTKTASSLYPLKNCTSDQWNFVPARAMLILEDFRMTSAGHLCQGFGSRATPVGGH
jgi:hypothetical protein